MIIECARCEKGFAVENPNKLPPGWAKEETPKHGTIIICDDCIKSSESIAPRFRGKVYMIGEDGAASVTSLTETSAEKLRKYIVEIERVDGEIGEYREQRREILGDAKALGFDTKAIREIIKRRKKDPKTLIEEEQMLDMYERVLENGVE